MTMADVEGVIELAAQGRLDLVSGRTILPFEDINQAFAGKHNGELTRVVFTVSEP